MTKVLINAINLSSAGGLTVALNFLNSASKKSNIKFIVIAPKNCGYEGYQDCQNIECILYRKMSSSYMRRLYFDFFILKNLVSRINPDAIFTMGNFAVPIKKRKQLLLFMWPYAIYPEAFRLYKVSIRQRLIQYLRLFSFRKRLKYADIVAPQTKVAQARLLKYFPGIKKTSIVPTAYSNLDSESAEVTIPQIAEDKTNLLCLTRYYIHKNIEILIEVARQFKYDGAAYRIILTMDIQEHPNVSKINNQIANENLEEHITNIGSVPITSVKKLYSCCHALILPTKLESFSATYADAMYFEKTIFTSNLDFALEVCGDVAYYFDPDSAVDITNTIYRGFEKDKVRKAKIRQGKQRIQKLPDWSQVSEQYITLISQLIKN